MTPPRAGAPIVGAPTWLLTLSGALLLGGPMWHELWTARYPFVRAEAWLLPLVFGAVGALIAFASRKLGRVPGSFVYGGLLLAHLDLQLNPQAWTYLAVVALGCVAVAAVFWTHRATLTALALGAFYATSLLRPPLVPRAAVASAAGNDANPVVVHVILDEMGGVGGLREGGDTVTSEFLRLFYRDRGFSVYEGAYSRFEITSASIPHALALGAEPTFHPDAASRPYIKSLASNPYLARLRARGYAIQVFQSTYFDFCRAADAPVAACEVENGNSIRNFGFLEGSAVRRASWVGRFYLSTRSYVFRKLRPKDEVWRRSVFGSGVAGIRALTEAIANGPRGGVAYFAHFLMPHRPTDVDAECRLLASMGDRFDYPAGLGDDSHRRALSIFGGQIRCTHRLLDAMLASLDRRVGRDRAIVLIHGDHGVRFRRGTARSDPLSHLTKAELVARYATLFAIRVPGQAASSHTESVPIQDLLWELSRNDYAPVARSDWAHYVRLVPERAGVVDTMRTLGATDMPWAKPPVLVP